MPKWPRRRIAGPGSKRLVTVLCFLAIGLLPIAAMAQLAAYGPQGEPLLPVPPPPTGPQAPSLPGQPVISSLTVAQRPRPELDPLGIQVGPFFWFPRAGLDEIYNSNIFATPNLTTSDLITSLGAGFDLLSIFPRNALNFRAGALSQLYSFHSDQNTQDGFASLDGKLDVSAGSSFYGTAQAAHQHIPRTSPNSPGNAAEPVTYNQYSANVGYIQQRFRFGYQADLAVQNAQYNAVPLIGGGLSPQSAQDYTYSQAALRGNYEIIPDYVGYVRLSGNLIRYTHTIPGGVRFNSNGYRVDFGLQILPRHLISGEVYAGYLNQIYRIGGSLPATDFGGRLVYNITPLTTAIFTGVRTVVPSNPSVSGTGTGYLATIVTASVDHELLRNLLLNGAVGYENDSYLGVSRTDNTLSTTIGFKYLASRNLYLGATYTFQQRNSNISGVDYTQNILMLRTSTQF
jgi:hypothetical protein